MGKAIKNFVMRRVTQSCKILLVKYLISIFNKKKIKFLKHLTTCCGCLDNTVLSDTSLTSSECHVIVCQATIVTASV